MRSSSSGSFWFFAKSNKTSAPSLTFDNARTTSRLAATSRLSSTTSGSRIGTIAFSPVLPSVWTSAMAFVPASDSFNRSWLLSFKTIRIASTLGALFGAFAANSKRAVSCPGILKSPTISTNSGLPRSCSSSFITTALTAGFASRSMFFNRLRASRSIELFAESAGPADSAAVATRHIPNQMPATIRLVAIGSRNFIAGTTWPSATRSTRLPSPAR